MVAQKKFQTDVAGALRELNKAENAILLGLAEQAA